MTLSDFRGAAGRISPEYFIDPQQTRTLLEAFSAMKEGLTADQLDSIVKNIAGDGREIRSTRGAEQWLMRWADRYFSRIGYLSKEAKAYMDAPRAWIREHIAGDDQTRMGRALAYLTVMCWVFDSMFDELDEMSRALMCGACRGVMQAETVLLGHLDTLRVSWNVSRDEKKDPLVRRLLVNPMDQPIELVLEADHQEKKLVCMAPHSCCLSLWVGDTITCIKGSITANGEYAYARSEGGFQELYLPGSKPAERCREVFSDFAAGKSRNLYRVYGHACMAPGTSTVIEDVLALFCCVADGELAWAALRENGSVSSRDAALSGRRQDVIAVVSSGGALHLITRGGSVITSDGEDLQGRGKERLMADMLSHWIDVTRTSCPTRAEQVGCGEYTAVLTAQGKLISGRKG